jgi:hypothetical protein
VKVRGGTVLLECPRFLIPLLSTCPGIDRLVAEGAPLPEFDVQVPLLSLPGLLGTTLETVPADMPYLSADAGRVERWRRVLGPLPGFRVGIVVLRIDVPPGEWIDRLTILEIRSRRLTEPGKLALVREELAALVGRREEAVPRFAELARVESALQAVNERLWQVEDELRLCERDGDFGPRFVELARSVYRNNDDRAALKRRISDLPGATFGEQKAYADYGRRS